MAASWDDIAHEVGEQLREARDQRVDDFQNHRLVPETDVAPKLAVVSIDGGRYQTRSEGQGPGAHDAAWREDKVADLVTMSTQSHDQDPHPELPRCFTEKKEVVELVQGITSQGALADVIDPTAERAAPLTVFEPAKDQADVAGGHPSRWYAPARRPPATAKPSARWWPPRRSDATSSPPRCGSSWATGGCGSGRSTGPSSRLLSRLSISCMS